MILQKSTGIKFLCILVLVFLFINCDNTDYQVLKIDNKNKIIKVLNSDYVIDSIAFEKNDKNIFSISLKDKLKGDSEINLLDISNDYKIHINNFEFNNCDEVGGIVFIRKKGFNGNISDEVIRQKKHYQEIQLFFSSLKPCSNSIEKINVLRRLK